MATVDLLLSTGTGTVQAAHIARDAREGGELVAGRNRLRLRELVEQRRLAHAREANHSNAPVSAPRDVETLMEALLLDCMAQFSQKGCCGLGHMGLAMVVPKQF